MADDAWVKFLNATREKLTTEKHRCIVKKLESLHSGVTLECPHLLIDSAFISLLHKSTENITIDKDKFVYIKKVVDTLTARGNTDVRETVVNPPAAPLTVSTADNMSTKQCSNGELSTTLPVILETVTHAPPVSPKSFVNDSVAAKTDEMTTPISSTFVITAPPVASLPINCETSASGGVSRMKVIDVLSQKKAEPVDHNGTQSCEVSTGPGTSNTAVVPESPSCSAVTKTEDDISVSSDVSVNVANSNKRRIDVSDFQSQPLKQCIPSKYRKTDEAIEDTQPLVKETTDEQMTTEPSVGSTTTGETATDEQMTTEASVGSTTTGETASTVNVPDMRADLEAAIAGITDDKVRKFLKKLYFNLARVMKKIEKLEEEDCSLDDMISDTLDTAYIRLAKYKQHATKIYRKIQELKGESLSTQRVQYKKILFDKSSYPELNTLITATINKSIDPPDYLDVLETVQKYSDDKKLGFARPQVESIAYSAFKNVMVRFKKRRYADLKDCFGSHLTDEAKLVPDPAAEDEELSEKLKTAKKSELDILKRFADEQEIRPSGETVLHLKNLSVETSLQEIKELFPSASRVDLPMDNSNQNIGHCFLVFKSELYSDKAFNIASNVILRDNKLEVCHANKEDVERLLKTSHVSEGSVAESVTSTADGDNDEDEDDDGDETAKEHESNEVISEDAFTCEDNNSDEPADLFDTSPSAASDTDPQSSGSILAEQERFPSPPLLLPPSASLTSRDKTIRVVCDSSDGTNDDDYNDDIQCLDDDVIDIA